jgi:hypothetical protein
VQAQSLNLPAGRRGSKFKVKNYIPKEQLAKSKWQLAKKVK